jgi:hypothetical protein
LTSDVSRQQHRATEAGLVHKVVGIFHSDQSILRLIGAVLLEANDEMAVAATLYAGRCMAELLSPTIKIEDEMTSTLPTQISTARRMTNDHLSYAAISTTLRAVPAAHASQGLARG